jgi:hypothetical protein
MSLPLDADGFLRRECPSCLQEFKWHHGKTASAPTDFVYPDVYWCPHCGRSAAHEAWFTQAQLAYIKEAASGAVHDQLSDMIKDVFKSGHNSLVRIEVSESERPDTPDPLVEPDDMMMIAPPCHPWEPVKVPEGAEDPFYCLVCGQTYAV